MEVVNAAMPTYEYLCQSCGARFDAWQKITDDPLETCPTCGGHVRRVLQPVGLLFKGSGFYKTDNPGSSAVTPPPSSESTAKEKPAAATSDTKSSATPATGAATGTSGE